MSLTKEEVSANAERYFKAGEKFDFMSEELIAFLGAEFVAAPASTMLELHNAYEGGLIEHILLVSEYAMKVNATLPADIQAEKASLIKVCMLHQIGKAKAYKVCESDWHRTKLGKMYEFKDDTTSMRIGERSVFYALSHGVTLSEDEAQAILNHDKDDTDKQAKWYSTIISEVLKQANMLAILEEKTRYKQSLQPKQETATA